MDKFLSQTDTTHEIDDAKVLVTKHTYSEEDPEEPEEFALELVEGAWPNNLTLKRYFSKGMPVRGSAQTMGKVGRVRLSGDMEDELWEDRED